MTQLRSSLLESDAQPYPVIPALHPDSEWLRLYTEAPLEPDVPIIDAHHHLGDMAGGYFVEDLHADTSAGHNVVASVFVQCHYAHRTQGPEHLRPVGETERIAQLAVNAERHGLPLRVAAGIVGFADLTLGDDVEEVLQAHLEAGAGRFRGIRHITALANLVNISPLGRGRPPGLLLSETFRAGARRLQAHGLTFDAWVYHEQLGEVVEFARALPGLAIVLNHVGGPLGAGPYAGRQDAVYASWLEGMRALATCPNVHVKIGGLLMALSGLEFHRGGAPPSSVQLAATMKPWVLPALDLFGAKRCMFESNFPVEKAMTSYVVLWNAFKRLVTGASDDEKRLLFNETANSFYRLGVD